MPVGKLPDEVTKQQQEIRDLKHEFDVTKLRKDIELEKGRPVNGVKTPEQALEEEVTNGVNQGMNLIDLERRLKAQADAEFPNDSDNRERKYCLIDREISKRIG